MAKKRPPKQCEQCDALAIGGSRFCSECRKALLTEMRDAGYLETGGMGPYRGSSRTKDQRQDIYETKYGPRNQ